MYILSKSIWALVAQTIFSFLATDSDGFQIVFLLETASIFLSNFLTKILATRVCFETAIGVGYWFVLTSRHSETDSITAVASRIATINMRSEEFSCSFKVSSLSRLRSFSSVSIILAVICSSSAFFSLSEAPVAIRICSMCSFSSESCSFNTIFSSSSSLATCSHC